APLEEASQERSLRLDVKTLEPPALTAAAAQLLALGSRSCRWPLGDPQHPDFRFCSRPIVAGSYCARHYGEAHMVRSLSEARPGFRCSPPAPPASTWRGSTHQEAACC